MGASALAGSTAAPIPASQMCTLGLIGGTSWYSTVEYYRYINHAVNQAYGDNTNPPLLLYNLNQERVFELQRENAWNQIADLLAHAARMLKAAGAEAVMFCANTPHKVYSLVVEKTGMRILHIGDATGAAIQRAGLHKVGLIGTLYTMEDGFMAAWLKQHYGVDTIVPASAEARRELHRVIQQELDMGVFKAETKRYVLDQIEQLRARGAAGIVLGCTEFPLIVKQSDLPFPGFDTTSLHAQMGVDFILRRL